MRPTLMLNAVATGSLPPDYAGAALTRIAEVAKASFKRLSEREEFDRKLNKVRSQLLSRGD